MENEDEKPYTIEEALKNFEELKNLVQETGRNEIENLDLIHDDLQILSVYFNTFVKKLKKAEYHAKHFEVDEFPEKELFGRIIYLVVSSFYDSPVFSKRNTGLIMVDDFITPAPFIYTKEWKTNIHNLYYILEAHLKTAKKSFIND